MSARAATTASEHPAADYEALRQHAIERLPTVTRHGLAVLLRQGVAVWMHSRAKGLVGSAGAVPLTTHTPRPSPMPEGMGAELVRVLTAMTLGHIEQVHT